MEGIVTIGVGSLFQYFTIRIEKTTFFEGAVYDPAELLKDDLSSLAALAE